MKREVNTKFYTFKQNNSGGYFVKTDDISEIVVIEALNNEDANTRAEELGMSNDGSCRCCGYRWDWSDKDDGYEEPTIYDEPLGQFMKSEYNFYKNAIIHYFDGSKEVILGNKV